MAREARAHDRIVSEVQGQVERGELRPGDPLPSESEFAAMYGLSRGTVRAALASLERAGVVETIPAKGRRVRDRSRPEEATSPGARGRAVAAELRAEIVSGRMEPGSAFLSERDVMGRFGVTRYTARAALVELEAAGLIVARHGRGRFVTEA